MGFLDNKGKESSTFGFNPSNWLQPKQRHSSANAEPFISLNLERGTILFNKSFQKKFGIKESFKIAFNMESFDTAFVIDPPGGIPFFKVKHYEKSGVASFVSKVLVDELKKAYEINGTYKQIYLRPMYYGKMNSMEIYKMIPYKDATSKFYDGKVIDRTGDEDPNPDHA